MEDISDNDYNVSRRTIRSSRLSSDLGEGVDDYTSSYSRRAIKSVGAADLGDGDNYSYSRRTIRTTTEAVGDGDNYTVRKSIRGSVEGSDVGESDLYLSHTSRRSAGSESKYARRSISTGSEEGNKYSRLDDTDVYGKYSKYSRSDSSNRKAVGEDEEDVYAKYSRKYSRTDSQASEATKTRRYSTEKRTDDDENDPYAKYAKKYLRKDSSSERRELDEETSNRYSRHYSRTESKESNKAQVEDRGE